MEEKKGQESTLDIIVQRKVEELSRHGQHPGAGGKSAVSVAITLDAS